MPPLRACCTASEPLELAGDALMLEAAKKRSFRDPQPLAAARVG